MVNFFLSFPTDMSLSFHLLSARACNKMRITSWIFFQKKQQQQRKQTENRGEKQQRILSHECELFREFVLVPTLVLKCLGIIWIFIWSFLVIFFFVLLSR